MTTPNYRGGLEFEKKGRVSIWIGDLDRGELDAYLAEQYDDDERRTPLSPFADDLAILWYDHDFLEAEAADVNVSIATLLAPLSFSSSYVEEASRAAGDRLCRCAILLFDYEYQTPTDRRTSKVEFLGSFDYDSRAEPVG